ncbi:MAG: YkgJ family cysteine cluster protein [Polyangiales bacterium]
MPARDFYFSFPDRVLHYDCAACDALCCRGRGMAAHADRELVPLLRREPALAGWVTEQRGRLVHFATPPGGCHFLEADRRCSIERSAGYEAKPSLCRAFPFNDIWQLEDTWLVAPHYLCPLTLRPRDASPENAGDHGKLARDLHESGWLDQPFQVPELSADETPAAFIGAERALLAACEAQLAHGSLPDACRAIAPDAERGVPELAALLAWPLAVSPALEPLCLTLAGTWSINHSRLPVSERRRALLLTRLCVGNALQLQSTVPTLKLCHGLWSAHAALIELLARGPLPMPRGLLLDTEDGMTMLAQAVIDRRARQGASMLEALQDGLAPLGLIERYTLLAALGQKLRKRARDAPRRE